MDPEIKEGWTGRKCPECNGHGCDDENRSCAACGGTGDEHGPIDIKPEPLVEK